MKRDVLKLTVLDDGTIKIETDRISMPNHASADAFVKEAARLAGGTTDIKRKQGTTHTHSHEHQHDHAHEDHQH